MDKEEKNVYNIFNNEKRLVIILIQIRPISDLQNVYNSIEKAILENEQTIYLTKNGYGSMVMMSLENYSKLTDCSNTVPLQAENANREHIEIISRPKKVIDEDDE